MYVINILLYYLTKLLFYHYLGKKNFNPKTRNFTDSELKPQPMVKKAQKVDT